MRWALPLLIIVVFVAAIVSSLLPNPKATAEGCPGFCPNLGLDLVGGLRGEYQVIATDNQAVTPDILNQTRDHHRGPRQLDRRRRSPTSRPQGGNRITVELPGAADADEIRQPRGHDRSAGLRGRAQPVRELDRGRAAAAGRAWTRRPSSAATRSAPRAPGPTRPASLAVDLELKETGANLFDDYAKAHYDERFAIVLDGKVISAPTINATSFNGRAQISGSFTTETMNDLVTVLKFGSLPLEIKEVGFSSLSATLGLGFLAQTVLAGLIGIGFVFAFMLVNYRLPGVIACIALLFYTLINYALFRTIPVTLTLAGIAGFVLSVGMAVDANILIFERTKEELRAGKPLNAAIEAGFNRAWSSIFDSNVSTLMTAFILWYFGSSTVKGFALVLMIGVLTSMFTAVTLSRMMLRWVVRQQWAKKASYYGIHEDQFVVSGPPRRRSTRGARPCLTSSGERKWFYAFSLAITIPGLLFILLTLIPGGSLGLQFSIAYRGGTEWTVQFANGAPEPADVVKVLDAQGLPGAEVLTTTNNGVEYTLIRTAALSLTTSQGVTNGALARSRCQRHGRLAIRHDRPPRAAPASPAGVRAPRVSCPSRRQRPAVPTSPSSGKLKEVEPALEAAFGPIDQTVELTSVGPVVSAELIQQTFLLILMGAVGIMLWITYRFRDFRMGAVALVSLVHDVIVVVGFFAILGTFIGLQIDALFVTAMLTVIGFSVHDTIVVFDRVRENRVRHSGEPYDAIVNHSILQTAGPLHQHVADGGVHAARAVPVRWRGDPLVRARAAHRHHLGDLLLDLQRLAAARRLAPLGRATAPARAGQAGQAAGTAGLTTDA